MHPLWCLRSGRKRCMRAWDYSVHCEPCATLTRPFNAGAIPRCCPAYASHVHAAAHARAPEAAQQHLANAGLLCPWLGWGQFRHEAQVSSSWHCQNNQQQHHHQVLVLQLQHTTAGRANRLMNAGRKKWREASQTLMARSRAGCANTCARTFSPWAAACVDRLRATASVTRTAGLPDGQPARAKGGASTECVSQRQRAPCVTCAHRPLVVPSSPAAQHRQPTEQRIRAHA